MKKIIAMLLAGVMALGVVAGCSQGEAPAEESASATESTPEATPSPEAESPSPEPEAEAAAMSADIVVIGAGGAGMSAAIQAVQDGATNVVILEKMPLTGGNTTRSTGGLNAAVTKYQEEAGIEDSIELFVQDTMTGGKDMNDPALVQKMAEESNAALEWVNSLGANLTVVGQFAGASVERIHRPEDTSAVGPRLVSVFNENIEKLNIPVLFETKATHIALNADGAVSGVVVEGPEGEYTIGCKAVVLATGGFGANSEMVVGYNPALAGFATTNHSGATGDGIAMAEEAGAALVDIDQIQTHPTVNPDTSDMYTEGVRGNGAILVNTEGKRFVNEMETRDVVSEAILAQPEGYCWLVFDQQVRESLAAIETYIKKGIIEEADTVEELAEKIGADPATLKATFDTYNGYVADKDDKEFGRIDTSMGFELNQPKFYAGKCAPAIHHTMGGVKIDTGTQVLKADGTAIPGLYAAGEVTGGVHGANRLGGNAVTDIVVFGRIAGSGAEQYVLANGGNTESSITGEVASPDVAPAAQGNFVDGNYTGTGQGNNGEITVDVTVSGGNITAIVLTNHGETAGIYEAAEKGVIAEIIRSQQLDVDAVSGATMTSNGIMEAVKNAVEGAMDQAA